MHKFSRLEIKQAEHEFAEMIKKHFGKVWSIPSDGEYVGCEGICRSMIMLDNNLWQLCQYAVHKGALRAAGRIQVIDSGHALKLTILFKPKKDGEKGIYERG